LGSASLKKQGEGSLTLANTNSFSGLIKVEAGTLSIAGKVENSNITVSPGALLRVEETGCIAGDDINLYCFSTPPVLNGTNTFTGTITLDAQSATEDIYYRFPHPGSFGNARKITVYPHSGKMTYLYLTNSGVYSTPIDMIVKTSSYHGLRLGIPNEGAIASKLDVKYHGNITAQAEQDVETIVTLYANKSGTFTVGKEDGSNTIDLETVYFRGNATHKIYANVTAKKVSRNDSGTSELLGGSINCSEFVFNQGYLVIGHENAISGNAIMFIGKDSQEYGGNHSSHLVLKGHDLTVAAIRETSIGLGGTRRITTQNDPATLTVKSDTLDSWFGSTSTLGDGFIGGKINLVKDGAATFDLNSTNSFTGSVTVRGGVLNARAKNSLGLGNLIAVENGTLALFNSNAASTKATLRIESLDGTSGTISLADGIDQQIEYLEVDGQMRYVGTYGSPTSAATYKYPCFTGNGILTVNNGLRGLTLFIK
jgi:autotransporter-associated beta strand protein